MAERCEIAFDHPSTRSDQPVSVSESEAEELAIDATGRQAMNDVLRENDRWFRDEVRRIYVMASGDQDGAAMLATSSMIEEVQNKSLADDDGSARRRLALERAGLEKPPSARTLPPAEQLLRLLESYGDRVERAMAERIGAEHARRYRDSRHNQSQSRSSGCPE